MKHAVRVRMLLSAAAVSTAVLFGIPAAADPIQANLTISIDALFGTHDVGVGKVATFSALPLPIGELELRHDRDAVHVEGLPPIAVTFQDIFSTDTSRISLLNATYRRTIGDGWFAGIGDTAYNQSTVFHGLNEAQASRLTGARYEVGRDWHLRATRIEASVAVNPVLSGPIVTSFSFNRGTPFAMVSLEHAAQADAMIRAGSRIAPHLDLVYGVRYLNLTSRFADAPGVLADRDAGFAPTLGLRARI